MLPPPSPARANFTLITECTPESSLCNSVYSVGGTSMGCRAEIRTRALQQASALTKPRYTLRATLHPNKDDLPIGGYVQDRLAAARILQEKAGPLLADSPILVSIHFLRDKRFINHVFPVLSARTTVGFQFIQCLLTLFFKVSDVFLRFSSNYQQWFYLTIIVVHQSNIISDSA